MVLPNTHKKKVKRAIQTFKNHSIAILVGVDLHFPIPLWSKLLPQDVLMLNLVCASNDCLNVSANVFIHGHFNYNTMSFAPLGCAIQLYENLDSRKTWGEN